MWVVIDAYVANTGRILISIVNRRKRGEEEKMRRRRRDQR